jgi:hypothetical protein
MSQSLSWIPNSSVSYLGSVPATRRRINLQRVKSPTISLTYSPASELKFVSFYHYSPVNLLGGNKFAVRN